MKQIDIKLSKLHLEECIETIIRNINNQLYGNKFDNFGTP